MMKKALKSISTALLSGALCFCGLGAVSALALTETDEALSVYRSEYEEILSYDFSGNAEKYIVGEPLNTYLPASESDYCKFYVRQYGDLSEGDTPGELSLSDGKLLFSGANAYQIKSRVAIYFPFSMFDSGHLYKISYDEQKPDSTKHMDISQLLFRPVADGSVSLGYMSFASPNGYALAENYNPGAVINVEHTFRFSSNDESATLYYEGQELNAEKFKGFALEISGDGMDWRNLEFFLDNFKISRDKNVYPEDSSPEDTVGAERPSALYEIRDFSDKKIGVNGGAVQPEYGKISLYRSDLATNYSFDGTLENSLAGISRARDGASFLTRLYDGTDDENDENGENEKNGIILGSEYLLKFRIRLNPVSSADSAPTKVAGLLLVRFKDDKGEVLMRRLVSQEIALTNEFVPLVLPVVTEAYRGTTAIYSRQGSFFDSEEDYLELDASTEILSVDAGVTVTEGSDNGIVLSEMSLGGQEVVKYTDFSAPEHISGDVNSSDFAFCLSTGGYAKRRSAYGYCHDGKNNSYGVGVKADKCEEGYVDFSARIFQGSPQLGSTYRFSVKMFPEQKTSAQFIFNVMTRSENGAYTSRYIYADGVSLAAGAWAELADYIAFSSYEREKKDPLTGQVVGTETVRVCSVGDQSVAFTDTVAALDVQVRLVAESKTLYFNVDDMSLLKSCKRVGLKISDSDSVIKNGSMENGDLIDGATPYGTVNAWASLEKDKRSGGVIESTEETACNGSRSLKFTHREAYWNAPVYRIRTSSVTAGYLYECGGFVKTYETALMALFMIVQIPDGQNGYTMYELTLSRANAKGETWTELDGEFSCFERDGKRYFENALGETLSFSSDTEIAAIEFGVRSWSEDSSNALTSFYLDEVFLTPGGEYDEHYTLYAIYEEPAEGKDNKYTYAYRLDGVLTAWSDCRIVSDKSRIVLSGNASPMPAKCGLDNAALYGFDVAFLSDVTGRINIRLAVEGDTEKLRVVKIDGKRLTNMSADFKDGECSFYIDEAGRYALIDASKIQKAGGFAWYDGVAAALTSLAVAAVCAFIFVGGKKKCD